MPTKISIIGAGPGGYVAAVRAAQLGADVTLVEKENLGGTCLNWGCIPSKIMKTTADILDSHRKGADYGIASTQAPVVDMHQLMGKKQKIIVQQIKGIENLLAVNNITLMKGSAFIDGPHSLKVTHSELGEKKVTWDKLIIATGTEPLGLPDFPFDKERIISSNEALNLTAVPESIVIVGGGVIGCEFASILASMGARVTLVEALDRLLPIPSLDPDCSKVLTREMKKRKITCLVSQTVKAIEPNEDGLVVTTQPSSPEGHQDENNVKTHTIQTRMVLVCIGRRPNTGGLGLENLGLTANPRGWIEADLQMQTPIADAYAIGDVLGPEKIMLAHVASAEGVVAAENAMGRPKSMCYDAVPAAIFTTPEVACVGITEEEACERGMAVRSDTALFRTLVKAQAIGELSGQLKIVSQKETGRIVGMHLIGPHATDLVAECTLAVQKGLCVKDLAETIHAHPTLAEIVFETSLKAIGLSLYG